MHRATYWRTVLATLAVTAAACLPNLAAAEDAPEDALSPSDRFVGPSPAEMQSPEMQREMQRAADEAAAEEERLDRPAEEQAREESRDAYQEMTDEEAQDLALASFPDLFEQPTVEPFEVPDGYELVRYTGQHTALVAPAGSDLLDPQPPADPSAATTGDGSLVESMLPLRARTESGALRPVSTNIVAEGDHLEAANPTTEAQLPLDLTEGVELPSLGITVSPGHAAQADGAEVVGVDKAFYANIQRDTDFFAAPTQVGFESFWQLRSIDSPEELTLTVEMPSGASLRPSNEGIGAEVVNGANQLLAIVKPPQAFDADGTPVAVKMDSEGDQLILTARHRAGDFKYPIQVDPEFYEGKVWTWGAACPGVGAFGVPGWRWEKWPPSHSMFPGCDNTNGVWNVAAAWQTFATNDYAQWVWAPPVNTYLSKVHFGGTRLTRGYYDPACTWIGIWSPGGYWLPGDVNTCSPFTGGDNVWSPGTGSPDNTAAVSQLYSHGSTAFANDAWTALGGYEVWVSDRHRPRFTSTPPTSEPWRNENVTYTRSATADDLGLGVERIELSSPNPANPSVHTVQTKSRTCGQTVTQCTSPTSFSETFQYNLPEGLNKLWMQATDYPGSTGTGWSGGGEYSWYQPIDRTPPQVQIPGGSLYSQRNAISPGQSYTLNINATDGDTTEQASRPDLKRSGVTKVEVFVDGERDARFSYSQECSTKPHWKDPIPNSCAFNAQTVPSSSWTTEPNEFGPGPHTIKVLATDAVGRTSPTGQTFVITVLPDDPRTLFEPGRLGLENFFHYDTIDTGAGSSANVNLASGNMVWNKIAASNPGRGLSSVLNLTYNSQDQPLVRDPALASRFLGLDYDEAGPGFSVGLSGLTRVNEPLGGVVAPALLGAPGRVTLTDADGTLHEFRPDAPATTGCTTGVPVTYQEPPGVNLRLRRFRCLSPSLAKPLTDTLELGNLNAAQLDDMGLDQLAPGGGKSFLELSRLSTTRPHEMVDLHASFVINALSTLENKDFWAITRPDGVTFYFNGFGYATMIRDRDGNEISFEYEKVNPLGQPCKQIRFGPRTAVPSPILPPVCEPRLTRVIDAAGTDGGPSDPDRSARSMTFAYNKLSDWLTSAQIAQIALENPSSSSQVNNNGTFRTFRSLQRSAVKVMTSAGVADPTSKLRVLNKIKTVTDHAQRRLAFAYDGSGRLQQLTEAQGTPAQRQTTFNYDTQQYAGAQAQAQLTEITDPNGKTTQVNYFDASTTDPRRRVKWVSDRNPDGSVPQGAVPADSHQYAYSAAAGNRQVTTVTEAQRNPTTGPAAARTQVTLDPRDRPESIVEAQGTPDERSTVLTWDDVDNTIASTVRPAGGAGQPAPVTTYTYNRNGQITSVTDRATLTSPVRTTTFSYCDNPGTQRSAVVDEGGGEFVSDLLSVTRPEGNRWSYELDGLARNGRSDSTYCQALRDRNVASSGPVPLEGHPTAEIDPAGVAARTSFNPDGTIASETDREGGFTEFRNFDRNGLPRVVEDAEDEIWNYTYDEVGNLTSATDPRGSVANPSGQPPADHPYTSTFVYDQLNRLTCERTPKLSELPFSPSAPCSGLSPPGGFVDRKYTYDANGNVTSARDGLRETTDFTYSPMDLIESETTPEVPVRRIEADGTEEMTQARLVTSYSYGAEEDLAAVTRPEGEASQAGGDFTTSFRLDSLGRPVAQVEKNTNGADKITSYAYDSRDNLRFITDPRRNHEASRTVEQAIAVARAGTDARVRLEYDLTDQLIRQIEDPGSGGINAQTTFEYDLNGNQTVTFHPRSFDPADPETQATVNAYNERDWLESTTDPEGGTTTYGYDDMGRVLTKESPRGEATPDIAGDFTTVYTYDARGDLASETLPWSEGQYGLSQAELEAFTVRYSRNEVGDPVEIRDPVGSLAAQRGEPYTPDGPDTPAEHTFKNTFFDSGELQSTERPSWWRLEWGSSPAAPTTGLRFGAQGAGGTPDPMMAEGGPTVVERPLLRQGTSSPQPLAGLPSEPGGAGDLGRVRPEALPDFLPAAGKAAFTYDAEMRLKTVAQHGDPADGSDNATSSIDYDEIGRVESKTWPFKPGNPITHVYAYDRNGNMSAYTDGAGELWTFAYDDFDRLVSERAPGAVATQSAATDALTTFSYDPNDNLKEVGTPRCVNDTPAPCGPSNQLVFTYGYDALDRLEEETNPANETWSYAYDREGNRISETSPRGTASATAGDFTTEVDYDLAGRPELITDPLGFETQISYDASGNQTRVEEPGSSTPGDSSPPDRVTETTYDGRDLPYQTTTAPGTASERTTVTEYDANGNLHRAVSPLGVGPDRLPLVPDTGDTAQATENATVYDYDRNDQLKGINLPWGNAISEVGTPATTNEIDQTAENQKRYRQERGYDELGRLKSITFPYKTGPGNPEPQASRVCYKHFDTGWISSATDPTEVNAQGGCAVPETSISYDFDKRGLQTKWETNGPKQDRAILRQYHANGLLASRLAKHSRNDHPGESTEADRLYSYDYNPNGSLVEIVDHAENRHTVIDRDAAEREHWVNETWGTGRDTLFAYDPDGNVIERFTDGTLDRGQAGPSDDSLTSATQASFEYDELGREQEMLVNPAGPNDPATEEDDNRLTTTDYYPSGELLRHDEAFSGVVETYSYAPDGRVARMEREDTAAPLGDSKDQTYTYDENGNRTEDERGTYAYNARSQTVLWTRDGNEPHPDTVVAYRLDGSGAIHDQNDAAGDDVHYTYVGDRLLKSETTPEPGQGAARTTIYEYNDFGSIKCAHFDDETCDDQSSIKYEYDAFERRKGSSAETGTVYRYDGLDRRDVKITDEGEPSEKLHELAYVGTSELLSREAEGAGEAKRYDYDSLGRRQGQTLLDGGTPEYRSYVLDANGSVESLENRDGSAVSGSDYHYDPYGELQQPTSLSPTAKENPFRFHGFYFDDEAATYDMQARTYDPEIGRFLGQDRYESAGAAVGLQSDPLTQNRYAFAAGNPVSRVEVDGHGVHCETCTPAEQSDLNGDMAQNMADARNNDDAGASGSGGTSATGGTAGSGQIAGPPTPRWIKQVNAAPPPAAVASEAPPEDPCSGPFSEFACDAADFANEHTLDVSINDISSCLQGSGQCVTIADNDPFRAAAGASNLTGITGGFRALATAGVNAGKAVARKLGITEGTEGAVKATKSSLPWRSWSGYQKTTVGGTEYAQVGERLYTRHAVDRMQPSGLGASAGGARGPGRSIAPDYVEDVIQTGAQRHVTVDGVPRTIHSSGSVQVVTEEGGRIVVTVNPFSGG